MKRLILAVLLAASAVALAQNKVGNANGVGAVSYTYGAVSANAAIQCRNFMPDAGPASQQVVFISGAASTDGGIATTDGGSKATAAPSLNGVVVDFTTISDPYKFKMGTTSTRVSVSAIDAGSSNCDFFTVLPIQ